MKLKEKVEFLINKLEEIYPTLEIPLDHKDTYTLLIAVLLSAQSTDKKVNEITPNLFSRADNPYELINTMVKFQMILVSWRNFPLLVIKQQVL